jgi:hypothetical protein
MKHFKLFGTYFRVRVYRNLPVVDQKKSAVPFSGVLPFHFQSMPRIGGRTYFVEIPFVGFHIRKSKYPISKIK